MEPRVLVASVLVVPARVEVLCRMAALRCAPGSATRLVVLWASVVTCPSLQLFLFLWGISVLAVWLASAAWLDLWTWRAGPWLLVSLC